MKRYLLIIFFCFCLPFSSFAQEKNKDIELKLPHNIISYRIAETATGTFTDFWQFLIDYQHAFTDVVGINFAAGATYITADEVNTYWGGGFDIGPIFYLSKKRVKGWWVLPSFELFFGDGTLEDTDGLGFTGDYLGASLVTGYNWVFNNGFHVGFGAGMAFRWYGGGLKDIDLSTFGSNLFPKFRLTLGYAF